MNDFFYHRRSKRVPDLRHEATRLVGLAGGEGGPVSAAVVQAPHPVADEGAGTGAGSG